MAKYSKFNIVYLLQKWMDSVAGQTFMNYAYSWGAAVVILGTLFKLTHLPGANVMLFIGMGTEVFVFFISAFDRPFDKTQDGRNLATDSELAAAALAAQNAGANGGATGVIDGVAAEGATVQNEENAGGQTIIVGGGNTGSAGGTIVIGGGNVGNAGGNIGNVGVVVGNAGSNAAFVAGGSNVTTEPATDDVQNTDGGTVIIGHDVLPKTSDDVTPITFSNPATEQQQVAPQPFVGAPAPAVSPETAKAMEEATTTYIDRLNELNELLLKVSAQSERLTTDSEEMENLNRTLTGISRVYEMQLKSASQQITTQDEINEQTKKMAQQIMELNSIYARMIEAMSSKVS